jgi:beta-glucosidase
MMPKQTLNVIANRLSALKKVMSLLILIIFLLADKTVFAQNTLYLDSRLPVEQRVNNLVSQLTLKQKVALLQYRGTEIKSNGLDIPAYNWWNECLHGVARAGKATVFPQAIGLAATWDAPFIGKVADAISDEARAKHEHFAAKDERGIYQGLNFWTPNINIFRDPRWGRGMETYGEDPYLTGTIASYFIRGLQGNDPKYFKTIATVKHFAVHSGPEQSRHRFNANVSDRDFYETYTPAFKMAIQDGGAYSLMCAYNRFRDKPCCGNDFLLTDLLRRQWGFKGFIVTDCGAVDDFFAKGAHEVVATPEAAAAMAIKAGVDLECGDVFNALNQAVKQKLVTEAELDVAIKRLFTARFKLGFFDKPADVKYTQIPYSVVESEAHKQLSLEAAKKSIVLLKNSGNILPLKKTIKTLAVIGPNADNQEVMLANYNGFPTHVVTPLEGIRKKLPGTKVLYALGSAHADGVAALTSIPADYFFQDADGKQKGLKATYFGDTSVQKQPLITRIDTNIDFSWMDNSPGGKIDEANFSASWSGYLKSPVTGKVALDIFGSSDFELYLDDKKTVSFSSIYGPGSNTNSVSLKQGQLYKVVIKYSNKGPSPQLKFSWQLPLDFQQQALNIASQADVVVMCMGLSPRVEGEEMKIKTEGFDGGDRTMLKLPQVQEKLIKAVVALGKPVVLVLLNGSAVAVNWEQQNIPGILETWYGGQQGGTAIADVLFGDYNPSGRLPVTFYKSEKDIPAFDNYDMKGKTYRYFTGTPLYTFGYGLSYTKFSYSNLRINATCKINTPVKVTVDIQNSGERDGEEVVELYIKNMNKGVQSPLLALKGFKRISLKKVEKQTVKMTIKPSDFSVITDNSEAIIEPGSYQISIGGRQPAKKGEVQKTNVLAKTISIQGKIYKLKSL